MRSRGRLRLTASEWALIVAILMGLTLVVLRWNYIASEVARAIRGYLE